MNVKILGLDLSLAATGVAGADGGTVVLNHAKDPEDEGNIDRITAIAETVLALARGCSVVVIEGFAFGAKGRAVYELGKLGGVVRYLLRVDAIPWAEVPPAVLQKFTTGKGRAGKDEMLATAIRRFGFEGYDNNAADAWLLRAMGLAFYERREVPAYQAEAMAKVSWRQVVSDGEGR